MRDLHLVEKIANTYRITEDAPLSEIFSERIERFIISPILERVREFCARIDKEFPDPYGPKKR